MNFEVVGLEAIPERRRSNARFGPLKATLLGNVGRAIKISGSELAELGIKTPSQTAGYLGGGWLPVNLRLRSRSTGGDCFLWLERIAPPDNNGGA